MNHDVAEVNGSIPQTLPRSFIYEKEPGYDRGLFYTMWDTHTNTPMDWKLLVPTLVPQATFVGREWGFTATMHRNTKGILNYVNRLIDYTTIDNWLPQSLTTLYKQKIGSLSKGHKVE